MDNQKNLTIYEKVRECPPEAQKRIQGGRLKGMTDINPMWRIKKLTEVFGPIGQGWTYRVTKKWLEPTSTGEVAAFVDVELRYRLDTESWSEPIEGTGGAMFMSKEKNGLYVDDEAYKKALTDALSVACKALGMAADIYWSSDRTKYSERPQPAPAPQLLTCKSCGAPIIGAKKMNGEIAKPEDIVKMTGGLCIACAKAAQG